MRVRRGLEGWVRYSLKMAEFSRVAVLAGVLLVGCSGNQDDDGGGASAVDAELVLQAAGEPQQMWTDLAFVDDMTGFAAGELSMFYKTTDGGATWSALSLPPNLTAPPNGGVIRSLHWESPTLGFISGGYGNSGYIAKSTDGGETWTIKSPPMLDWAEVIDFDGDLGLAAGTGFLMRTTDAGETWTRIVTVPSTETFERLSMADPARLLLGSRQNVYASTDQGVTWTIIGTANYFGNLQMQSGSVGYNYNGTELYKTTDGAISWSKVWAQKAEFPTALDNNFFVPEPNVVAFQQITPERRFFVSKDGGSSFTTYTLPDNEVESLSLTRSGLWRHYRAHGGYLYVFTSKSSSGSDKALYRIRY